MSQKTWVCVLVIGITLLVGLAFGTLVCLAALGSRTKLRFLLVDLSGRLVVPTWACKNGSSCDLNAVAARTVRSGLFAVSWTPGKTPADLNSLTDAVWEWEDGKLKHFATGNYVAVGGAASSGQSPLSLNLNSSGATVWSTKPDALGRVGFTSRGSNQIMASAILSPSSPAVVALPPSASSDGYSTSFVTLPWSLT
jgi:hypothetical protein